MKGRNAIAKILKMEGVEFVSGFPQNDIFEARAEAGIRCIIARTERVGVNIADAYTRVSNCKHNGVCLLQSGPGIENAYSGIAQAYSESVPILVMRAGADRRQQRPPSFMAAKNYQGVTKWADTINFADRIPEMMRRAFTLMRTGRPVRCCWKCRWIL